MADIINFDPASVGIGFTYGSSMSVQPRVNVVEFGDGYVQRSGDGLNTQPLQVSAQFTNLINAERDYLINFFVERGGYKAFTWTLARYGTRKFVCQKWSETPMTSGATSIEATFQEVFDIA